MTLLNRGHETVPLREMQRQPRHGRLEVDEDAAFQRRDWRGQRIGWAALALLLLAGALGLLGGVGPFAQSEVGSDSDVTLVYDRVARHGDNAEMAVTVAPSVVHDGQVRLWFDARFLNGLEVESVSPEPTDVAVDGRRVVYTFDVGTSGTADLIFHVRPDDMWSRTGEVGVEGGPSYRFSQFVLP